MHPHLSDEPPRLNLTEKDLNLNILSKEPSYDLDPQLAGKGNSTMVRMCPATEYWQDEMTNLSDKIVNDLHYDGIYYDMIAAVMPEPCYDRSHNHTMGGGHHW